MRGWCEVFAALVVITSPSIASAQTATQLWTNAIVVWLPSDALTSAVGVETRTNPAVVKLTPHVDYTVVSWADVLAEADVEHQADSAWTVTPRFGAQFYIFSRLFLHDTHAAEEREKRPRRRLVVSTLLRFEDANSSWRMRDRFNLGYPLNRHKITDDGALYLISDYEVFVPIKRQADAALVTNARLRAGFGYREDFKWRFELLYIWNGTRNAESDPLTTQSHAIDVRVRWEF